MRLIFDYDSAAVLRAAVAMAFHNAEQLSFITEYWRIASGLI